MILTLKVLTTEFGERGCHHQPVTQYYVNESTGIEYKGEFNEQFLFNDDTQESNTIRSLIKFFIKQNDTYILQENVNDQNIIDNHSGNGCCHLTIDI